jgi:ribosome maturation factor RimP
MEIAAEIKQLAEAKLVSPHHFIVDVVVSSKRGPTKVLIILDGDEGVNIEDCAGLSRELSGALDEAPYLTDSFTLEVTTPGLDQPLVLQRQYRKNIGRRLKVKLKDKTVEGKLTSLETDNIRLEMEIGSGKNKEVKTIEIPISEIEKAFVIVSFK